jgi:hypothetical protein
MVEITQGKLISFEMTPTNKGVGRVCGIAYVGQVMNSEDVVMAFGAHRGKKLSQVPHDYLKWMEKAIQDKPELIAHVKAVLAANKPVQTVDPNDVAKVKAELDREKRKPRPRFTLTSKNIDAVLSLGEALPPEVYINAPSKTEMEAILMKCEEYTGCMVKTRWAAQGRVLLPEATHSYVFNWLKSDHQGRPIPVYVYNMDQTIFDADEEERLKCLDALNALARGSTTTEEE